MIKVVRLLTNALLAAMLLAACQGSANNEADSTAALSSDSTDCRTIEHEIEEIEVCSQPERIVVLGPYVLEPLLALDVQPVGYADRLAFHTGDYTEPDRQIPYLGDRIASLQENRVTQPLANVGTAGTPSLEAILKLQPDLIIATDDNTEQYEQLSEIAPTLVLDWMDAKGTLEAIAEAVDRSELAEQLWTQQQAQIAVAKDTFAPFVAEHPTVLLLSSTNLQDIQVSNAGFGRCRSLLEELGFQIASPPDLNTSRAGEWASLSIETLPQLDSDLLFMFGSNISGFDLSKGTASFEKHQLEEVKEAWGENAIAQSLEATKAERVYFFPAYQCLGLPGTIGTNIYLQKLKAQLMSKN